MTEKFVNRVSTTLSGSMSASTQGASETWAVASVTGLPTTGEFRMVVVEPGTADTEIFKITSVNVGANEVTGLRGQEGTPAAAHASGKMISMIVTAGGLGQLATDTLARIAATSPLSVSLDGDGDPTLAIQAANGSQDGYLSSAFWTKLNGIATGAQVNVLESVSGTAPISVAAVASKNQVISIAASSGSAAGTQSAAHYSDHANATDLANANTLVKRDANGDATIRYLSATFLKPSFDDNFAAQPQRLWGKQSGNDFLHTYNPANVTVGLATALATGADRTKLDSIDTGVHIVDANGWVKTAMPNGKNMFFQEWVAQSSPASSEAVLKTITKPVGITDFGDLYVVAVTLVIPGGQGTIMSLRYGTTGSTSGSPVGKTQAEVVFRDIDGTNMSTRHSVYSLFVTLMER